MNSTKIASIDLAASLAAVLLAIPAQATSLTRTFVSSAGSDSNPCSITQPCATFARAYSLTAASGIIAALDPGKYGPVTITGPVTINGNGWASITGPASGNAITINAVSGKVTLIGLEIDGANAANSIGIEFNSGASLTVRDSTIQNFTRYGILYQPNASSKISMMNTQVSDNNFGIYIGPTGSGTTNGVLDHVHTDNSTNDGITVISSSQTVNIIITESVSANNGDDGVVVTGSNNANVVVWVRNSTVAYNSTFGLQANGITSGIGITRSTITGNGTAIDEENSNFITIFSYGDNNIFLNANAGVTPPPEQHQ